MKKTITIDGPAGAGKSTVAKLLAKKLDYLYIDTGAMYRAVAYNALKQNIAFDDKKALTELANNIKIELASKGEECYVYSDGIDISQEIRLPEVGEAASPISAILGVRENLVAQQKRMAKTAEKVVMDGRDAGTKVLPQADLKIFLTADIKERAKRRWEELKIKGIDRDLANVEEEINKRDNQDSNRKHSPLMQAEDAILLDTTDLNIEQVVEKIRELAVD